MQKRTIQDIKAEAVVVHMFNSGAPTQIHAQGCAHVAKARTKVLPVDVSLLASKDDYFEVAPCAVVAQ